MKKILLIGAVAAIALSSCGKKHHCEEPEIMVCGTDEYGDKHDWDKEGEWDDDDKDVYYQNDLKETDDIDHKGKKKWWWKKKKFDKDDCDPRPMDLDK